MFGLRIKAVKDEARIFGLILIAGHEMDIDIMSHQADLVRASVAAGDIVILAGAESMPALPAEPAPAKPKGK